MSNEGICRKCFTCQTCVTSQEGRTQTPQKTRQPQRQQKEKPLTEARIKELVLEILIETGLLQTVKGKKIDPSNT